MLSLAIPFLFVGIGWAAPVQENQEAIWAVLVAGSKGYWNYRHQSDISAAYQLLIQRGVPKSQIITMMNPHRGKLYNWPGGPDVYAGVEVDYRLQDVNLGNLKAVLLGDAGNITGNGTGRVLKSNKQSHLFFYFTDHGAFEALQLPTGELIMENEFTKLMKEMMDREMFGSAMVFLEACESGSMVENWGTFNNVFAATAASATEPSYATHCLDFVLDTCMADEFSYNWMDTARRLSPKESLEGLTILTKAKTKRSNVQEIGSLQMKTRSNGAYLGSHVSKTLAQLDYKNYTAQATQPTWKIPLIQLERRAASGDIKHVQNLRIFTQKLSKLEHVLEKLKHDLPISSHFKLSSNNFDKNCYGEALQEFINRCSDRDIDSFALRNARIFASACAHQETAAILKILESSCP
ncbi:unnamed protein product, partial [Mesorhabditis spiculigera]